jgi:hypothetical protein
MFVKALAGLSFLVWVGVNPGIISPDGDRAPVSLTTREKVAILHPLIDIANDCVAEAVASNPRLGKREVTDLIVESFNQCVGPVRAMIDAHDRYYGPGSGEQFFMGPYLDALPAVVTGIVTRTAR